MRIHALAFMLTLGSLLAGCESMSEDQCRRADWHQRGRDDGRTGEPDGYIDSHHKACAKAGVVPDARLWRQGWAEGIRSYCVPHVAWQRGLDNGNYQGACRDFDEASWLAWYRAGKDAHKTRSERDSRQREIGKLEEQLKKSEKEDERKTLREKIRQLDIEQARLRRLLDAQISGAPK
jgi:major membrane immunogen (membrane-anchored lipoprotein)